MLYVEAKMDTQRSPNDSQDRPQGPELGYIDFLYEGTHQ